jgi:molecular chaperone GrpE (heat shock protein)
MAKTKTKPKAKPKPKPIKVTDEFAAAMQQLSAEAEKTLPSHLRIVSEESQLENGASSAKEIRALTLRLANLENILIKKIDNLAVAPALQSADIAERLQRIEQQVLSVRTTESVSQQLFDSLHDELLKYRDNFLHESLQKPFIHDLVHLFDDLTSLSEQLRNAAATDAQCAGHATVWSDNLENALHSLMEILHRFDVKEIEPKEVVDRALHRVVSFEPANFPEEDGRIVMRVKRGFLWRGKMVRPEEVIAKRFG